MGLDMYAYRVKKEDAVSDFQYRYDDEDQPLEIHYWRKHPNLHGWMEDLYISKGGTEEFNCVPVRLTIEDLEDLEKAIRNKELPNTSGFFFGKSQEDEEEFADDLQFITDARQAITDGYEVFYNSWW
jgi:hypothetical protein